MRNKNEDKQNPSRQFACATESKMPKSGWDWTRTSARLDWDTQIALSQDMQRELHTIIETLCHVAVKTTTEPSPSAHSATVQASAIHAQLTGGSPCHAMFLLIIRRVMTFLMTNDVLAGVAGYAWMTDPSWEPSPASKFVQRYSQHRTCYHFRILLFGDGAIPVKGSSSVGGSLTAAILFSKKAPSFTCWIFNEANMSPPLPPSGRARQLCLDLWEHFRFTNAITRDDALRIEHLFQFACATKSETFQKYMPPLSFSTGAHESFVYVLQILDHLVRTLSWEDMQREAVADRSLVTEHPEGINVSVLFSWLNKNGQIRAHMTLRPSFLKDSQPVSSWELFFTQIVPWDAD